MRRLSSVIVGALILLCIVMIALSSLATSNSTKLKVVQNSNDSANKSYQQNDNRYVENIEIQELPNILNTSDTKAEIFNVVLSGIMNITRAEIALQMKDFENIDEKFELSKLIPDKNGTPIMNLILSTWRSGSTFFGDILNSLPGTYYHFEPLMYFGDIRIRNETKMISEALETLHQLLRCNYIEQDSYMERLMLQYNTRLQRFCSAFPSYELCSNQTFLSSYCSLFPFQTAKLVRLRAAFAEPLLTDSDLNVKIVLLIRDPRGIVSSRNREKWCHQGIVVHGVRSSECGEYQHICPDMISDFKAAQVLTKKYPQRFTVLRYEDLSQDPYEVSKNILNFYGLPFHDDVKTFLDSHTNHDDGKTMSTSRKTKNIVFSWRHKLTFDEIEKYQSQCTEAMNLWGYKKMENEGDWKNESFYPLLRSPFDMEN